VIKFGNSLGKGGFKAFFEETISKIKARTIHPWSMGPGRF
jgi:hypothetical protein